MRLTGRFFALLASISATLFGAGCGQADKPDTSNWDAEAVIRLYNEQPIGESLEPVVRALTRGDIFFPAPNADAVSQKSLAIPAGKDMNGQDWAYVYTSPVELRKAFPDIEHQHTVPFADFINTVTRNEHFGGIFLNAGSDVAYLIPAELFTVVIDFVHDEQSTIAKSSSPPPNVEPAAPHTP